MMEPPVDPFNWSVDEVVKYLCYGSFDAWARSTTPSPRPDPAILETALRENDVTGDILLTEVDKSTLAQDFALKSLGQRSTIFKAIRYLQTISRKYGEIANQQNLEPAQSPSLAASPATNYYVSQHSQFIPSNGSPNPFLTPQAIRPPRPTPTSRSEFYPNEIQQNTPSRIVSPPSINPPVRIEQTSDRPNTLRKNEEFVVTTAGRKRRRLNLSRRQNSVSSFNPLGAPQPTEEQYYDPRRLTIENIFHQDIPAEDDNDDDEFCFVQNKKPPRGQTLFINQCLLHSLQQIPQNLEIRGDKTGLAVIPYSKPIYPKDSLRYFTLFVKSNKKVIVSREDISQWPQLDRDETMDYLLAKYPPIENEITALPLYGDSESEGGYDSDTWNEIQNEREKEKDKQTEESTLISRAEVDAVIDDSVNSYAERWRTETLPVESRKAWKIWTQSRIKRTRILDIKAATDMTVRLNDRLEALRKAIKNEKWTKGKKNDLQQQCRSMEPTVTEREFQKWKMSILQLATCPPKMPKEPGATRRPPRKINLQEDEESLGFNTDEFSDAESDFIVEDDARVQEPHPQESSTIPETIELETEKDNVATPRKKPSGTGREHRKEPSSQNNDRLLSPSANPHLTPLKVPIQDIEIVDLTRSDEEEIGESNDAVQEGFEIKTPPLNPVENQSDNHVLLDTPPDIKLEVAKVQPIEDKIFPEFHDVEGIRNVNVNTLEERHDRKRLLAHLIYIISDKERFELYNLVRSTRPGRWRRHTRVALQCLLKKNKKENWHGGHAHLYLRTASLYVSWNTCKKHRSKGIYKRDVDAAINRGNLDRFHNHLTDILRSCCSPANEAASQREASCEVVAHIPKIFKKETSKSDERAPHLESKEGENEERKDTEEEPSESNQEVPNNLTPRKKRKRPVKQSQEAMNTQMRAQQRMEHQEAQQKRLSRKLESLGFENDDPERKIVNLEEPIIYLDPHIGRHVKPHQLAGIRFIWREIIKDEKRQGCLLAHTMGLGKTMQVISFLVTLANASNSVDLAVKAQIPEPLRKSRTLILCPSSLIENWWEEFMMWTPRDEITHRNLGGIRKVTAANTTLERQSIISTWHLEGGVLLISYNIYSSLVLKCPASTRDLHYSPATSDELRDYLINGPNIIIADEAHKMKDPKTGIAEATKLFGSKSRIALTGSPLANKLAEYYAMIDWISPNYLGTLTQFKAKYVEPIQNGSYADSSRAERRKALKKLQVLKTDLDPKVNRADISVLEQSLPQKVEFVITVPLTPLQEEAYSIYIEDLSADKEGGKANTRIMNWLSILSLLCSHPSCFLDKLTERNDSRKVKNVTLESDSECISEDVPTSNILPNSLISRMKELFNSVENLKCPSLSHRTRILDQIIEESIKAGDKIIVFSHSIPTLDYLESILVSKNRKFSRLDGKTPIAMRQTATKAFNQKDSASCIYLISTRAGGLGLNIPGANRVVIFDFDFNPTWEEQAVGRAYRFGQRKNVFVYRFLTGGTYQNEIHNKTVFKTQLSYQVVDKKTLIQHATKFGKGYLYKPKQVEQEDLSEFHGKDPLVLDKILSDEKQIRKIELTETFQRERNEKLTPEEEKEIQELLDEERLQRNDPEGWARKQFEIERVRSVNLSRSGFPVNMPPPPLPMNYAPGTQRLPPFPVPGSYTNAPPAPGPDMSLFTAATPQTPTMTDNNPAMLRWKPPQVSAPTRVSQIAPAPLPSQPPLSNPQPNDTTSQPSQSQAANVSNNVNTANKQASNTAAQDKNVLEQTDKPAEKPSEVSTNPVTV